MPGFGAGAPWRNRFAVQEQPERYTPALDVEGTRQARSNPTTFAPTPNMILRFTFLVVALPAILFGETCSTRLLPIDETRQSESFVNFRSELASAVERKDLNFVLDHLKPDILVSFGRGFGREEFLDYWNLRSKPENSRLWSTLEELLSLGATCENDSCTVFVIPYFYSRWPDEYDPYFYSAIRSEAAPLRIEMSLDSAAIDTLSYDIVKDVNEPNPRDEAGREWKRVTTLDGVSGYVLASDWRSAIGYRAQFEYLKGRWQIGFLVAGD